MGQLLASIAHARNAAREMGGGSGPVLLSSSTRLRLADHNFRQHFGEPDSVMPLRALSYMIHLVPDVTLGAGTLRQALFDFGRSARLTDVERFALRVIRGSGEYNIPWARRRTLENQLDKVIRSEASKREMTEAALRKQVAIGNPQVEPDLIIVEAVRNMALNDTRQVELLEAKQTIRKLETQLEDLREFTKVVPSESGDPRQPEPRA